MLWRRWQRARQRHHLLPRVAPSAERGNTLVTEVTPAIAVHLVLHDTSPVISSLLLLLPLLLLWMVVVVVLWRQCGDTGIKGAPIGKDEGRLWGCWGGGAGR